jgi:hypothetical protein
MPESMHQEEATGEGIATAENPNAIECAGLVSVCAWCAPRDLRDLPNATHGICDACLRATLCEAFPGLQPEAIE